jgi:hypothetical protein
MSPVATSDAVFRGGACPTPEYTIAYTGNYTTSADASQVELALSGLHLRDIHVKEADGISLEALPLRLVALNVGQA